MTPEQERALANLDLAVALLLYEWKPTPAMRAELDRVLREWRRFMGWS